MSYSDCNLDNLENVPFLIIVISLYWRLLEGGRGREGGEGGREGGREREGEGGREGGREREGERKYFNHIKLSNIYGILYVSLWLINCDLLNQIIINYEMCYMYMYHNLFLFI